MDIELESDFETIPVFKLKFVIFETLGDTKTLVAKLFGKLEQHVDVAEKILSQRKDLQFLGAGEVALDATCAWGSSSCKKKFGYDKPDEPRGAEVLTTLQTAVKAKFGK